MSSTISPWNSASEDIIDELVFHLKRTGRWSRDARPLRALNRHWCAALNRHVVEVKPYESRRLVDEDIDSLLKFRNLTALETTQFEGPGLPAETIDRCWKLAKVLPQLSSLRCLTVRYLVRWLEESDLRNLKSIKEMNFDMGAFNHDLQIDWINLAKIREWPIEKLSGTFHLDDLSNFISEMPSLKVVEFQQYGPISIEQMKRFVSLSSRLDVVSMSLCSSLYIEQLTAMDNLNRLKINKAVQTFEPFVGIRTTSMDFSICSVHVLNTAAFQNAVSGLKELRMTYFAGDCQLIPGNCLRGATNLEKLFLDCCCFNAELIENLQKLPLKEVSLISPDAYADLSILQKWTTLKELSVSVSLSRKEIKTLSSFSSLKRLKVTAYHARSKYFEAIGNLTALESLEIFGAFDNSISLSDLEKLCNLRQLRSLTLIGTFNCRLEILWEKIKSLDLEFLRIKNITTIPDTPSPNCFIDTLKTTRPHLDFEFKSVYFHP